MPITSIKKRDGRIVDFDENKITSAIVKAFDATYKPGNEKAAQNLTREVVSILEMEGEQIPEVEHIQDLVEKSSYGQRVYHNRKSVYHIP